MKNLSRFGLIVFCIGLVLFFVRTVKADFLPSIDDVYINILWPIGLLIYSVSKAALQKKVSDSEEA